MFETDEFEGNQMAGCKSKAMGTGNGVWGWGDQAAMHPASYITTIEQDRQKEYNRTGNRNSNK